MNKVQKRIEKAISEYSCALMNNTKWREVLEVVGRCNMPIQFSFVSEERYKMETYFPEDGCTSEAAKDCTIHGPFYLKEIFSIRFPKFEEKRDSETGKRYMDDGRFDRFMRELSEIGQLPIEMTGEHGVIKGYEKSS